MQTRTCVTPFAEMAKPTPRNGSLVPPFYETKHNIIVYLKTSIMKRIVFIVFLLTILSSIEAQERSISLGLHTGYYRANDYDKIQPGQDFSTELKFFINERLYISANALYAISRYYESDKSNYPDFSVDENGTNADLSTIHVGLQIGYRVQFLDIFYVAGQTGISSYTESARFPWQYDESTYAYANSAFTDLAFPMQFSLGALLTDHFELALIGGFYIEPDYPIVGLHIGPQLNIKF